MLESSEFPINMIHNLYGRQTQIDPNGPKFGIYSNKANNLNNLEDYLNFSWKFDTSCYSDLEDKFTWFDNLSDVFSVDLDDKISSHYDSTILEMSTMESRMQSYLYGTVYFDEQNQNSSWNLPESHPLKVTMVLPGSEDFPLNHNWYERLQSSFRNLWIIKRGDKLSEFENEYEHSLLRDVGLFANACKNGSTKLLCSLISSNFTKFHEDFLEVSQDSFPLIYKFHRPKFKDDRLFLRDGIVFTLVVGDKESYNKMSYTTVKKFYSNDFKGRQALCDAVHSLARASRFAVPFCCVTDYMGFRVFAEPLVPLRNETKFLLDDILGYDYNNPHQDSHLITSYFLSNSELSNDLIKLSNYLRVSSWPLPFGSSDLNDSKLVRNNANAVVSNGFVHFRNTHEVLPPYLDYKTEFDQFYKNRFRQEFSCFYHKGPLKCTFNSQSLFDKDFDNSMFQTAYEYNIFFLENNIDKFHTMYESWDVSNTLHSFGLNIRNLGKIYEKTCHSSLKDVIGCEMASRAFKHLWDLELENIMTSNSLSLSGLQEMFLDMLNDFLGLTLDSLSFWYQKIHPQISLHFNVIDLQDFDFKSLPQGLLISSIEFNMGVVVPKIDNGQKLCCRIELEEFKSQNSSSLLVSGLFCSRPSNFYPKVSVSFPRFNLSIYKAASKLCGNNGDSGSIDLEYRVLSLSLKILEGFDGFLNLQLLIVICYDLWNRKEYAKCVSYINKSKECFLHLFSVKNYEWVPVYFLSLLGYCNKSLNVHFDSTKIHHEVVRHCNLSSLPTYTKCNLLWLFLESLIRVGSYLFACKVSNDMLNILEPEFGPLSMEYLRGIYVSAWIHRQIGSIHFIHPYLYLSNSENVMLYKYKNGQEWFENQDLIMEELSSANNCLDKRKHLRESLKLYTVLLDKFLFLSKQNKMKVLEIVKNLDSGFCTSDLDKVVNITYETLLKHGNEAIIEAIEDTFLKIYLDQSTVFQSKLALVLEHFLTLKILSLDTNQYHSIANKLYNAYASQVSSEFTRHLSTGSNCVHENSNLFNLKENSINNKQFYGYGTRIVRPSESFSSHLSIKKNIIPRSGHDLRSVESLLMGQPEYSRRKICEMCISCCQSGDDFNNWFDGVFDFIHPKCVLSGDKFLLSLDILRNFSTPCQRLYILGHLSSISRSDLDQTYTFKMFKRNMLNSNDNKTHWS